MPKVSIIIPAYNASDYINESLESVFAQTYTDFEILVVDDGSVDNTKQVLDKYKDRIHYYYQKNSGPSAARNHGIAKANGELIAFLDADDLWLPNKLERQVEIFQNKPGIGIVGCGFIRFGETGGEVVVPGATYESKSELLSDLRIRSISSGSASGVLVAAECFKNVGVFEEGMRGSEDRDMWYRIILKYDIEIIKDALIKTRVHADNVSRTQIEMMRNNQQMFINKHLLSLPWPIKQRAIAYTYLDAAREYCTSGNNIKALKNAILSIIYYPLKLYKNDDKYKIVIKAIIRRCKSCIDN